MMNEKNRINKNDIGIIVFFAISLVIMFIISVVDISIFTNQIANEMVLNSISRIIGGIVFVVIMFSFGYKKLFQFNGPILKVLLIIIPGLIVAINNFPIIAYFADRAAITQPVYTIYLFVVECISIGFFEEIVFRGVVLILLLQRLPQNKKGMYMSIIISSAIFGLIHIVNLFSGAGFGDTVLQIGYSFLMGMMWAVIYLKTKNIWMAILLHSTYNFFGLILFRLGYVNGRYDNVTIITTVLLALIVIGYTLYISYKIDSKKLSGFISLENV